MHCTHSIDGHGAALRSPRTTLSALLPPEIEARRPDMGASRDQRSTLSMCERIISPHSHGEDGMVGLPGHDALLTLLLWRCIRVISLFARVSAKQQRRGAQIENGEAKKKVANHAP